MPELNKANRRVCDVYITTLKTGKPFLYLETANTTTQSLSGDSVYALARGERAIAWDEPAEGTMTIEAQVLPFKVYALMSDGVIRNDAEFPVHETIACTEAGKLTLANEPNGGVAFVFAKGEFGNGDGIVGTVADSAFTATTPADIKVGDEYEVGYIVKKTTGVNRISFGSKFEVQDYIVVMSTLEKDEQGVQTPYIMKAYKAKPQRNFEMSQASTGDPASITLTFDLLRDKDGNFFDMIEDTENAE